MRKEPIPLIIPKITPNITPNIILIALQPIVVTMIPWGHHAPAPVTGGPQQGHQPPTGGQFNISFFRWPFSHSVRTKLDAVFLSALQPCGHFLAANGDGSAVFTTKQPLRKCSTCFLQTKINLLRLDQIYLACFFIFTLLHNVTVIKHYSLKK